MHFFLLQVSTDERENDYNNETSKCYSLFYR